MGTKGIRKWWNHNLILIDFPAWINASATLLFILVEWIRDLLKICITGILCFMALHKKHFPILWRSFGVYYRETVRTSKLWPSILNCESRSHKHSQEYISFLSFGLTLSYERGLYSFIPPCNRTTWAEVNLRNQLEIRSGLVRTLCRRSEIRN